jgi:hypothetical protein
LDFEELKTYRIGAYGEQKTVLELLQVMTREEIEEAFEGILEWTLQAGRL